MWRTAFVAAMMAVCAAGAAQADGQTVSVLRPVEAKSSRDPALAGCGAVLISAGPIAQARLPASVAPQACFAGSVGHATLYAAWDERRENVLRLDTDRDKDLTREAPLRSVDTRYEGSTRVHVFGPIVVAAREGSTVGAAVKAEVFQTGAGSAHIRIYPAAFLTGSVPLGGRPVQIALVDGDCDGALTPGGPNGNGDWLGIDRDGDGKINPDWVASTELMPLPEKLELAGEYYRLEVADGASVLRLTPVQPEFGALDVGTPDAQLVAWSDYGAMTLPFGGRWQLPAGSYRVLRVTLARNGRNGHAWRLNSSSVGSLSAFQIAPGQTLRLRVGTPLVAEGLLEGQAPSLQVSLKLTGQGGEEYQPGATRDGITVTAPKFQVVDQNGRRLISDQFEYG